MRDDQKRTFTILLVMFDGFLQLAISGCLRSHTPLKSVRKSLISFPFFHHVRVENLVLRPRATRCGMNAPNNHDNPKGPGYIKADECSHGCKPLLINFQIEFQPQQRSEGEGGSASVPLRIATKRSPARVMTGQQRERPKGCEPPADPPGPLARAHRGLGGTHPPRNALKHRGELVDFKMSTLGRAKSRKEASTLNSSDLCSMS
jgi:hypothetical protein